METSESTVQGIKQNNFYVTSNNNKFPQLYVKKMSYDSKHILLTIYETYSIDLNDTYVDVWYKNVSLEDHILLNVIDGHGKELYSEKFIGLSQIKEEYVNFDYSSSDFVERVFKIKYSVRIRDLKR